MMKKSIGAFILVLFIFQSTVYAQLPKDYQKWGRIAVDVTKLNYADSDVSDYEYVGRVKISDERVKDSFKLEVKREGQAFDVQVSVFHNPKTNSLITLEMQRIPTQ